MGHLQKREDERLREMTEYWKWSKETIYVKIFYTKLRSLNCCFIRIESAMCTYLNYLIWIFFQLFWSLIFLLFFLTHTVNTIHYLTSSLFYGIVQYLSFSPQKTNKRIKDWHCFPPIHTSWKCVIFMLAIEKPQHQYCFNYLHVPRQDWGIKVLPDFLD